MSSKVGARRIKNSGEQESLGRRSSVIERDRNVPDERLQTAAMEYSADVTVCLLVSRPRVHERLIQRSEPGHRAERQVLMVDASGPRTLELIEQLMRDPAAEAMSHAPGAAELSDLAEKMSGEWLQSRPMRHPAPGSVPITGGARPMDLGRDGSTDLRRKLLDRAVPLLRNEKSGRLNASSIAHFFGLTVAEVARLIDRPVSTVHKTPDAPSLQSALLAFERAAAMLLRLGGSEEAARFWLNVPNHELSDRCPIDVIHERKIEVLVDLLEDAWPGAAS